MNWITIAWPMVTAACLTLGLIELRIGLARPPRAAPLLFASSAFVVASIAGLELALMRTDDFAHWWPLMRSMDIAVGAMILLMTAFVWVYFGTGRKWLALAVPGFYAIGLAFDYLPGAPAGFGMTYQSFTGFRTVETFGGASFHLAVGVPNPWNVFPYLAVLALVGFVLDASVTLWHRGERRRAAVVGGAVVFFFLLAGGHSALVEIGIVDTPYMISWAYVAILVAMASELNADVLAAASLAGKLRETERRMNLASAAVNLGFWAWDLNDDTIWASGRARALMGFSESEPLNFPRFLGALLPEDRVTVNRAVESVLATDRDYEAEYRVSLSDGKTRWVAARGQVDRDRKGKPMLLRGVVQDISARRGTDVELQELRTQLTHASRVSMMGQLASALAHELSQPLGAILRNTEAAELFLEHEPPDLDELRAILADIRQDDQRAGSVIDRLRALLKRRNFAPSVLSVSELLEKVIALTRVDASARKAKLKIDAAVGLPPVMGDAVQIQQVLLNLILNAMDAVEDAPAGRHMVTVRAQRRGEREVEVAVTDAGLGIAPDKLPHLFEPFFTTKLSGMGIGLSISRTIIAAHGGRIWAENNPLEGATFAFTLPVAAQVAPS